MNRKSQDKISRRKVLKGSAALGLGFLPFAGLASTPAKGQSEAQIKGALDVRKTAQAGKSELLPGLEMVNLKTKGGRSVTGALALPPTLSPTLLPSGPTTSGQEITKAPALLLVHEWWGLNDQIKAEARALADEGFIVLAVDLYNGVVAQTAADARFQVRNVKAAEAADTLTSWGRWLRGHKASTGKLGTCGWCFGGGWSLEGSLAMPVDATVVYYGNVAKTADELGALQGPVLGHFGTRDMRINRQMVNGFSAEMAKAGRLATIYWYEADHAFANRASSRHDEPNTKLARDRTLEFLKTNLT